MTDHHGHAVTQHPARIEHAPGRTAPLTTAGLGRRLHDWVVEHDDSKLFLALYIGLAVVLSIWISLFWLVAVVAVHFGFEVVRQLRYQPGPRQVVLEALWELKLDIALVLFALALTLYMELVLGVVGLQGAARVGAASRVATRFAGWERTIRGLLLSVDDVAQVVRAVAMRRRAAAVPADAAPAVAAAVPSTRAVGAGSRWASWAGTYTAGAWISLGLAAACTLLILAAPWLTPHSAATAVATLATELRPLP